MPIYKTRGGIRRKIRWIQESIETFRELRGSTTGTFWQDVAAVDKAIEGKKLEIVYYTNMLKGLTEKPELIKQLRESEIF